MQNTKLLGAVLAVCAAALVPSAGAAKCVGIWKDNGLFFTLELVSGGLLQYNVYQRKRSIQANNPWREYTIPIEGNVGTFRSGQTIKIPMQGGKIAKGDATYHDKRGKEKARGLCE